MTRTGGSLRVGCAPPVAIVGATASGKSALAMALACRHAGSEIVSLDSMVVYRGMDIGTSKASVAERQEVCHHLIDLAEPWEDFSVQRFQEAARQVMAGLADRGRPAVLVGGTGLYVRAVVDQLSLPGRWPELAAQLEREADGPGGPAALHARLEALDPVASARMLPANRRRVIRALEVTLGSGSPFSSYGPGLATYEPSAVRLVGIRMDRETRARRIASRVAAQMETGWLDEVRVLLAQPGGLSRTARQALGYRELIAHVEHGLPLGRCVQEAVRRTRAFARRQDSWFARDPRITWVDSAGDDTANLVAKVEEVVGDW